MITESYPCGWRQFVTKAIFIAASWLMVMIYGVGAPAVAIAANAEMDGAFATSPDTIPPGTRITMSNWQNYKQFMSDGMAALFAG